MEQTSSWRGALRELLQETLGTTEEFDAFCLDWFPNVYARFTSGMDRVARTNLLLQSLYGHMSMLSALQRHNCERVDEAFSRRSWPERLLAFHEWPAARRESVERQRRDDSEAWKRERISTGPERLSIVSIRIPPVSPTADPEHTLFNANQLESLQELLDSLYDQLGERFEARSYGKAWALVQETSDDLWQVLLPFEFICTPRRRAYRADRMWMIETSLDKCGLRNGTLWRVISLKQACVFGLMTRSEKLLDSLMRSARNVDELCADEQLKPLRAEDLGDRLSGLFTTHPHKELVYSRTQSGLDRHLVVQTPLD